MNTTTEQLKNSVLTEASDGGIVSCRPEAALSQVAELMAVNRVHAIVVVDDDRPEPPVITELDLVSAVASGHFDGLTAADIAANEAISLRHDDTLIHAAQLMAEHRVSHLLVRNERRDPVGIVSTLDIAAAIS